MGEPWINIDEIQWFKAVNGNLIAPVATVKEHIGDRPPHGIPLSVAQGAIVDGGGLGRCYSRNLLVYDAHIDRMHYAATANSTAYAGDVPEVVQAGDKADISPIEQIFSEA